MFRGRHPARTGTSPVPAITRFHVMLLSAVIAACTPANFSSIRTPEEVAREPGAVAVIAMERFALGAKSCDLEKTAACVGGAITRERPWVPVVSQEDFLQVAFPGLELGEIPSEPKYVELLLEDDEFQARIAKLRLGFLVVVGGLKRTRDLWGEYFCAFGPPAGMACVVLEANEEETHIAATVFSIGQGGQRREIAASGKGPTRCSAWWWRGTSWAARSNSRDGK